ncbi:MAG: DUF2237 domain-containing protein [Verrucomicrobiota bacterium]
MFPDLNVYGEPLEVCCKDPMTGFYRNGCCSTGEEDLGSHTVCVKVTEEFLMHSIMAGNDLSTPRPEFGFAGLKAGDRWCLCAGRWKEAYEAGAAPCVYLKSTHQAALEYVSRSVLEEFAVDDLVAE